MAPIYLGKTTDFIIEDDNTHPDNVEPSQHSTPQVITPKVTELQVLCDKSGESLYWNSGLKKSCENNSNF